ncbi:MAG TPA: ATP-binding protein [Syntrophales bacterium]|nr:ATP-binding protein [Syntrophales bacterium]
MNNSEIADSQYLFLQKSFNEFNQATTRLQKAFTNLEIKFEQINKELELKNEELKQTIEEKEKVKNYLRNILESLTTGVVVTDLDGKITTINRCAETFWGISQDQAEGKDIKFLFTDLNIADWKIFHTDYSPDKGGKINIKDKIIEIFVSPMRSEQGEIIGTVFILRDVTRIEKLEEMAKRTEKLAAMGEMAANIAHEIRNPLGSIELFASLLMKDIKDKNYQSRLSNIITSVKNMDNKISNLLLFTTQKNPIMRNINLHRIMKEVLLFSDPIIKQEGISLSVTYSDVEPYVRGDAELLKQVFLNILLNSIQAMADGGSLRIETIVSHEREVVSTSNRNVEVRISDTGVGIPRENLKKIFDPFFSTRERGSGLGLAIVHNIVHVHNGTIDVESKEKEGTIFSILLPLIQGMQDYEIADNLNIIGDRYE